MALQTDSTPVHLSTASVLTANAVFPGSGAARSYTSGAWPTVNLAIYIPVFLPFRYAAQRCFYVNGSSVAGNVDFGVYNEDFSKVQSTGNVAQAGTNTVQYVSFVQTLNPGSYYFALSCSGAATFMRCGGVSVVYTEAAGIIQQSSANPLPSPAVPVVVTNDFQPLIGLTRTASGF